MKVCIFDHHTAPHPVAMGGISKLVEILAEELPQTGIELTLLLSDGDGQSTFQPEGVNVIYLNRQEIQNIRDGITPVAHYFSGDVFHTQTSGKHANFNLTGFGGRWLATCHGSDGEDAAAEFLAFVGKTQLYNHSKLYQSHLRSKYCFVAPNCWEQGLAYREGPHDRLTWLGEIRPDKGVHLLPGIAKRVGRPIHIYGLKSHDKYFDKYLKPALGDTIEYHGFVGTVEQKNELFAQADIFVHPALFHEPFGITLVEAMKCGVPFTGFNHGSLPELTLDQKFLAKNRWELASLLKNHHSTFSREDWIKHAEHYSPQNFAQNYHRIYRFIRNYPYL